MATEATTNPFTERFNALQQQRGAGEQPSTTNVQAFTPKETKIDTDLIFVKPIAKSWEDLVAMLDELEALNKSGMYRVRNLKTLRSLYDQGYSAELETAAELASKLATKKEVSHYFASMISKRGGNWLPKTLPKVQETWEVRKNALEVMKQLKLDKKITNYVLSLAWKFKGVIVRFLSIATEKGYGITNPAGYFFGIIKSALATT